MFQHSDMKNSEAGEILKLTRTLSSEIDIETLSCDIMRSALLISGAERGYCFFAEDSAPVLKAAGYRTGQPAGGGITVNASEPLSVEKSVFDDSGNLRMPLSVLHRVSATGKDVFMNDIRRHPDFPDDRHLRNGRVCSLLCLRRDCGMSKVMLYLESGPKQEKPGCGCSERIGMLAAQGAVSLENARRYQEQEKTLRQLKHVRNIKDSLLRYNERIRIDALQQKINAPFLTTAMNTLRELAKTDIEKADNATIFLGEVFRYITDESFSPVVPFHREWDFVRAYLDFEKLRLYPNLSTLMAWSGDFSSVTVPPLTLQSFIQIATDTWCGGSADGNLDLHLFATCGHNDVIIETRCRGKGVAPITAPAGLFDTTKERLHHVSGETGIELRQNGPQDISIVLKFSITGKVGHEQ